MSFVLGFPRAAVAELFYTINYHQKPVNKSQLYDLVGEFSQELDEITFMHEVVRVLNEVERSPFHRRVKMLGVREENAPPEIRERMTISQAFLIDYLVNTISRGAMRSNAFPPIFLYHYIEPKRHAAIIRFLLNFFSAVRSARAADWENPAASVICNSIGVGALIRVMHFLYVKMFVGELRQDPDVLKDVETSLLVERLRGIEDVDFSKQEWSGASSGGALNHLMKRAVTSIHYFEAATYDEFLEEYKSRYLAPFKKWLVANT